MTDIIVLPLFVIFMYKMFGSNRGVFRFCISSETTVGIKNIHLFRTSCLTLFLIVNNKRKVSDKLSDVLGENVGH